ncbi:uncharacterized protein SPSK_03363 [Sporothrix schenckii 1099-18]|uniref:Uncharacterized protein n=1 Tax=Sporothrix schenckii 1099-18 TaxID=1397361 RepID=A0A0F2M223_SPOSC|nr:uncharacterized protein SPSK_03363 [Sporothrix schenckii 1099-18]KJR82186.1 hypothetical protein SPSK_03363 [Sporothrix schenckii 1099-18]
MSLSGSAPLANTGSSHSQTLAPPFEPIAASSSSSTAHDEQATAVTGSASNEKKQKKRRSIFGFGKNKVEGAGADTSSSAASAARAASTSPATGASLPPPTLSKSPPPPPPKTGSLSNTGVAPKPPAKDVPARKPTSPILTDNFSPMSASITSSGVGGSTTTGGSNYGGYYVLPPSSPGRSIAALSSSPRMSSPAGSQIFERDVQENNSVLMPGSPAIPSHITTENFIPPVLDASSEAITDGHLDPDTVEIITHAHHQPAGLAVAGGGGSGGGGVNSSAASGTFAWVDDVASSFVSDKDDNASNYGSFDTTDVRRLSFISFADVVQAEHQQQQQQQATAGPGSLAGLTSLAALSGAINRSPSPMRSPTTTDRFGTSPPASKSGSVKNLDLSPQRNPSAAPSKALGSPTRSPKIAAISTGSGSALLQVAGGGNGAGEISVETMSQALRRTGSGDLSGVRSTPQSPI